MKKIFVSLSLLLLLAACGAPTNTGPIPGFDENGRPKSPYIKLGKPYTIQGRTYYPEHDANYSEEGKASWYGPGFYGRKTANGEIMNSWEITAAHRTLPLPSMVRITHLGTGKSIVARVNDRGPYANDRIIDLSHGAAQALGVIGEGVADVKVEYLPAESTRYAELLTEGRAPSQINVQRDVIEPVQLAQADTADENATRIDRIEVAEADPATTTRIEKSSSILEKLNPISEAHAETIPTKRRGIVKSSNVVTTRTRDLPPLEDASPPPSNKSLYDVLDKPESTSDTSAASSDSPPKKSASVNEPHYYILLGAFSKPESVERIRKTFAGDGVIEVKPISAMGKTLSRVQIGPVDSYEKANSLLAKAHGSSIPDAKIIVVK